MFHTIFLSNVCCEVIELVDLTLRSIMALIAFNIIRNAMKPYTHSNVRLISNVIIRSTNNDQKDSFIVKKFTELNESYVKLLGLDELKRLQERVIVTQDKLEKAQETRREIAKQLNAIRKRSNQLQEQLHKVKRYEDRQRFLELTMEETEVIKTECELSKEFDELDKTEREIFTALSNAVRDSHERERAQSEYTKYWGIILSIIGTFVGAILSMIINTIRTRELVGGIEKGIERNMTVMDGKINNVNDKVRSIDGKISTALVSGNQHSKNDDIKMVVNEIKKDNKAISGPIMEVLDQQQQQMNLILKNLKTHFVLPVEELKGTVKYLDLEVFVQSQMNILEEHQQQIKSLISEQSRSYIPLAVGICLVAVILRFAG